MRRISEISEKSTRVGLFFSILMIVVVAAHVLAFRFLSLATKVVGSGSALPFMPTSPESIFQLDQSLSFTAGVMVFLASARSAWRSRAYVDDEPKRDEVEAMPALTRRRPI